MKRRLLTAIATLVMGAGAALGVAACGDDDDDSTTVEEIESVTTDVTETIRPKRAFIIGLHAARISRNAASRLTWMTDANSSSFIRIVKLSRVIPALLTRMSSLPSASTARGIN